MISSPCIRRNTLRYCALRGLSMARRDFPVPLCALRSPLYKFVLTYFGEPTEALLHVKADGTRILAVDVPE